MKGGIMMPRDKDYFGPGFWMGRPGRHFRTVRFWGSYPASGPGWGPGWGYGGGPGWGWCRYWQAGPGPYAGPPWVPYGQSPTDEAEYLKAEAEALKLEAEALKSELAEIKKRIAEIEEKTGQGE